MTGMNYTELSELARDLGKLSSPQVVTAVQKAVGHSALGIKNAWNAKLYTEGHADRTGRSISYDVGVARDFGLFQTDLLQGADSATIVAEIGPKRGLGKQAGVVRLLENGSVHNPPHGYGASALHENEADFDARIAFAIWAAERDAGL
jgi:hypothetical protein